MYAKNLFKAVVEPSICRFRGRFSACGDVIQSAGTASTRHTSRPVYRSSTTSGAVNSLYKSIWGLNCSELASLNSKRSLGQRCCFSTVSRSDGPGTEWRRRVVGCQPFQNLKVGPYKRGKWFVSYKDDPGSFITNILILLVTGYSIFTMMPGESMKVRRQRKLRQVLLDNAQMTEADLVYIENYRLPEDK